MPALKLIYLAAGVIFGSFQVFSQDYPFIRYTQKDGLINNRVHNLHQDVKGRIFFLTANGLSVYDGARFLNYTTDDGLANPTVNDILELSEDSLLIATNTGVLNVWVRGTIKKIQTKNGFCPVINKFYRDKDNVIFVASDQGLFRFDNDVFISLHDEQTGHSASFFDQIVEIGESFLLKRSELTSEFSNLLLFDKATSQFRPFLTDHRVSCLFPLKKEQLLLAISNQKLLCLDLNAAQRGLTAFKKLPPRLHALSQLPLNNIIEDRYGNMWAVSGKGIVRINADGSLQTFDLKNGRDVTTVRSIVIDRENVLWIMSDGSGITKLVNRNVELQPADIRALYEDSSGNRWVLKHSNDALFCANDGKVLKWQLSSATNFTGLGKRKRSVVLFDAFSVYETVPAEGVSHLKVDRIFSDSTKQINSTRAEIGSNDNVYIPGKSLTIITLQNKVKRISLPDYVDQVSLDHHEQLWAVSRSGHLLRFKINPQASAEPLTLTFTDKVDIPEPRSMTIDETGKVWIGTRFSGLYCLEYRDGKIVSKKHWTTADGLTDNFIYHLACDDNNVIWAGTQGGLDKISFSGHIVESISRNNNIYEVVHKIMIGGRKNVWAFGIGRIIRVTDDVAVDHNYQPRLQIVRMTSAGKNLLTSSDRTILPFRTHELTIDVAAPSFIDEKRVRFSYLLEGTEKGEWSPPSSEASFRFISLPPAEYSLRIKAFFPVADYQNDELVYHFTILPPWWRTWWFRSILILVFFTGIALSIKAYYHDKLKKQKIILEKQEAVQQERTRIAMEMHDDLGSGLTVIRYLASGLMTNSPSMIKEKALKIETSARQLVDNMNDIVWTMKSDNNLLSDVMGYIRKQAAEMLENVGVDYRLDFHKNIKDFILTNEQKRNILLICKEAIHNIIKHSDATMVSIEARQEGRILHFRFSDNGKGMNKEMTGYTGNGLKNMKQRANQMGGNVEIINTRGTTLIVTLRLA